MGKVARHLAKRCRIPTMSREFFESPREVYTRLAEPAKLDGLGVQVSLHTVFEDKSIMESSFQVIDKY